MTPAAHKNADQLLRRFSRRFGLTSLALCTMLLLTGSASALIGGAPSLPTGGLPAVDASASHEGVSASTDGQSAELCIDRDLDGNSAYGHLDAAKSHASTVTSQLPDVPVDAPVSTSDVPRPSLPSAGADGCISADATGHASADLCADASGIKKPDLPVDAGLAMASLPVDTPDLPEAPDSIDACGDASHSDGSVTGGAQSDSVNRFVGQIGSLWSFFSGIF